MTVLFSKEKKSPKAFTVFKVLAYFNMHIFAPQTEDHLRSQQAAVLPRLFRCQHLSSSGSAYTAQKSNATKQMQNQAEANTNMLQAVTTHIK